MELGLIGLGTMGANLARNAARNGAKVAVYNRTTQKTDAFMKQYSKEGNFVAAKSYEELLKALTPPRAVLIMVKAGPAVDAVIEDLLPHLDKGDIIIDGGNSHFPDSNRRYTQLQEKGIEFLGLGVSGGEEGALHGPSMMPGGSESAYKTLQPLLQSMAADDGIGGKCVTYLGEAGVGHFVKMVHNGIEYGLMQLLAESYDVLKNIGGLSNQELSEAYTDWQESRVLNSFLVEITAKIFQQKDSDTEGDLIDYIDDAAGQKGTGKWTTQAALDYGVAIPSINAAVDARIISGSVDLRTSRVGTLAGVLDETESIPQKMKMRSQMRNALKQSFISTYQQGFDLIEAASKEEDWNVDLSEVARIWMGGCIIRSELLKLYQKIYSSNANESKAANEEVLQRFSQERQLDWRKIISLATQRGVSVPAMSASLSHFDSFRRKLLPQNLVQAQRDFFGAHTYERTDKDGKFHTDWE